MEQEEILEKKLNENDNKKDKTQKILIIMAILFLFCATYYYYNVFKQGTVISGNTKQPLATSGIKTDMKSSISQKISEKVEKPAPAKPEQDNTAKTVVNPNSTIKPSDKTNLIRLAALAAGKPDPFASTDNAVSGNINQPKGHTNYTKFNSLPPPPTSIGSLPTIGELPKINFPQGQPGLGVQEPEDIISVKGFWGDKVIVSINGITESLSTNQSFQGVKVVNVDPEGFVARFKKDGKIITKGIKDLEKMGNQNDINGNELRKLTTNKIKLPQLTSRQNSASAFFAPGYAEKLVKNLNR